MNVRTLNGLRSSGDAPLSAPMNIAAHFCFHQMTRGRPFDEGKNVRGTSGDRIKKLFVEVWVVGFCRKLLGNEKKGVTSVQIGSLPDILFPSCRAVTSS